MKTGLGLETNTIPPLYAGLNVDAMKCGRDSDSTDGTWKPCNQGDRGD